MDFDLSFDVDTGSFDEELENLEFPILVDSSDLSDSDIFHIICQLDRLTLIDKRTFVSSILMTCTDDVFERFQTMCNSKELRKIMPEC